MSLITGRYWVYAGGRRVQAFQALRERVGEAWATIAGYVSEKSDREAALESLSENVHRQSLTPVEQGRAMLRLMEGEGWTQKELAAHLQLDYSYVRKLVSGTRHVLASAELRALDCARPLTFGLLALLPSEPELRVPFVTAYQQGQARSRDEARELLRRWRGGGTSVECAGAFVHPDPGRLDVFLRLGEELERILQPGLWDAPLTAAEREQLLALGPHLTALFEQIKRLLAV